MYFFVIANVYSIIANILLLYGRLAITVTTISDESYGNKMVFIESRVCSYKYVSNHCLLAASNQVYFCRKACHLTSVNPSYLIYHSNCVQVFCEVSQTPESLNKEVSINMHYLGVLDTPLYKFLCCS